MDQPVLWNLSVENQIKKDNKVLKNGLKLINRVMSQS